MHCFRKILLERCKWQPEGKRQVPSEENAACDKLHCREVALGRGPQRQVSKHPEAGGIREVIYFKM